MHADRHARHGHRGRILVGALGSALALGAFIAAATAVAGREQPRPPARPAGLGIVVRTPQHLARAGDVDPVVRRFVAQGVQRAWVQVKQDESDELPAGTAFYPSAIAPVAEGFEDGRLDRLVEGLAGAGIEPLAWMPVLHDEAAAAAHPEWRSQRVLPDGTLELEDGWLCPFDPEVARYEASLAAEVAMRYPDLGGLYLDFIRYDGDYSCACPSCLEELDARIGFEERTGRPFAPADLLRAGEAHDATWTAWTALRAERIVDVVDTIRDAVEEVRPDFRIGAFVLPFSARSYDQNTQAGQDLERMSRAGLDELVLMGYWDDWDRDPNWVREGLDGAARLVGDEAELSVVLDGDMGVRRTRLTLEALGPWAGKASWFTYGPWTDDAFERLGRAIDGHRAEGAMAPPDHVSVVIRIDTEPDYQPSYDAVRPEMIDAIVDLLDEEDVRATFITVGRLAELQPDAVRRAAAAGHEIGSHSWDHEQIDALPVEAQLASVDRGLTSLARLGFDVHGFGAPRNSITDEARDRLMDWGLEYDGSAAYDPLAGLVDVHYATRSDGGDGRIVVVPFIVPNDWDARFVGDLSADEMADAWTTRLDRVVASGEPVFVLDVHQWAVSEPENLEALRTFIEHARACDVCRIETLREAAVNARDVLDRYEPPAPTSGTGTAPALVALRPEATS